MNPVLTQPVPGPTNFDWLADLAPAFAAQESWIAGSYNEEGLFHLLYKPDGPFAIASGTGLFSEHIKRFRFSPDVIQRLGQVTDDRGRCVFHESFLNHLQRMRLRVNVYAPPEGMLLLPGEPLVIARGPYDQVLLLESAMRWLIWRSTQWATRVAVKRWENSDWKEEDAPSMPATGFYPDGWKIRAEYIGGASADDILDTIRLPSRPPDEQEGLVCVWRASAGNVGHTLPLTQIRRVYRSNHALGDIWLTDDLEEYASVSKTNARIHDVRTQRSRMLKFTRFQNLYQPVLSKGHPVMTNPRLGYLRQRTLKQLEAFHHENLEAYPHGWYLSSGTY